MYATVSKSVAVCFLFSSQMISAQSHIPTQDKPNIIVILSDDLGYGDPVCYVKNDISEKLNLAESQSVIMKELQNRLTAIKNSSGVRK